MADRVPRLVPVVAAITIVAVTVVTFWTSLSGEFLNWDDDMYFLTNDAYRGLGPANVGWMFTEFHYGGYYPVAWLTWGFDYELWGMDPYGYHLSNVGLHAVAAVLVYALLCDVLARAGHRRSVWRHVAAAGAALPFAVHPLRVEAVAWIVGRREVLLAIFWTLAVLLYLRARDADRPARFPNALLAASVLAYLASMLAKSFAITFPALLLALDAWPLRRFGRERVWRILADKVPYAVIAVAVGYVARLAQAEGGAVRDFAAHSLLARCAQAVYGLVFYLEKTFVPVGLAPLHPLETQLDWHEPRYLVAATIVLVVAAALCWLRRRAPWLAVAGFAYAITLLPVLGFFQSGPQLVAERYSYVASLPLAALVAGGLAWCAGRGLRWVAAVTTAGLVVVLSVRSHRYCAVWRDSVALWSHTAGVYPHGIQAAYNLGRALVGEKRFAEAIAHYQRAADLYPPYADAWYGVGLASFHAGRYEPALAAFRETLARRPNDAKAIYFLGLASLELGRYDDAIRHARAALDADPSWIHSFPVMAEAYRRQGDLEAARRTAEEALRRDPDNAEAKRVLERLPR